MLIIMFAIIYGAVNWITQNYIHQQNGCYSTCFITSSLMDHSPIRQTSELGKFISTAGKSITNLVKL